VFRGIRREMGQTLAAQQNRHISFSSSPNEKTVFQLLSVA
jgi:hypothetical protein